MSTKNKGALRQKATKGPKKVFCVSLMLDAWADEWWTDPIQIDVETADEENFLTANVVASDEDEARAIAERLWRQPIERIRREAEEADFQMENDHAVQRERELLALDEEVAS